MSSANESWSVISIAVLLALLLGIVIGVVLKTENPDFKLIEKCNNVDVPKVSKAVTSCGDALEKYVKFPKFDSEYVQEVTDCFAVS